MSCDEKNKRVPATGTPVCKVSLSKSFAHYCAMTFRIPRLVDVRITAVVLSVDYRHARVHFALVGTIENVDGARAPACRDRAEFGSLGES